ncbi:MAG: hypothetical protein ACYC6L_01865 [Anaerolineae bacterium]
MVRANRFAYFVLLAAALVLVGCGAAAPSPAPQPAPGGSQQITLGDNNKTITLAVNERVLLNLGEGYTWNVTVADQSVISRVVNITVIRGAQGVYEAHKAGQTTLTAVGDPACRTAKPPCEQPSRSFSVTIVVK